MDRKRTFTRVVTAVTVSLSLLLCPVTDLDGYAAVKAPSAPADEGKSEAELNGLSEEEWASLNDNVLEYGEIENLIRYFNPTVSDLWNQQGSTVSDITDIINGLENSQREIRTDKEETGTDTDTAGYDNDVLQEKALSNLILSYTAARDKAKRPVSSKNRTVRETQAALTKGAQALFISYNSLKDKTDIQSEFTDLDQKLYEDAVAKRNAGTGTAADITAASAELVSARSGLFALKAEEESVRKKLIIMCGWTEDASPEIGDAPASDLSRIDAMNPDTDLTEAIANNQEVISFRAGDHKISTASHQVRDLTEEEMNQNIMANLKEYYGEVLSDEAAFQAAEKGLRNAEILENAAKMQYGNGRISGAEYRKTEISCFRSRAAYSEADRTLLLAMETYDWAVKGICPAE